MSLIEVISDSNYDKFKFIKGNRKTNDALVRKLIASMSQKLLETHIIVNEKYEIIEGQHRFLALKHLNHPIRYVMIPGYNIQDTQRYNTTSRKWNMDDWLNYYLTHKNKEKYLEYHNLDKLMKKFNLSLSLLRTVSQTGANRNEDFKAGKFIIENPAFAQLTLERYKLILTKVPKHFVKTRTFLRAFMLFSLEKDFDWYYFNSRLDTHNHELSSADSVQNYILNIQQFHNKNKKKNRVVLEIS